MAITGVPVWQVLMESREEEPGKILHELRLGKMVRCGEVPHTPYYSTVDATPLWLILDADYYAWTNDQELLDLEFECSSGTPACRVVRKRGNLRVVIEA
ncbi:MAG: hypothetical protein F6K19_26965 [Cyanothece sp. SIO1E1]|nr:hypothetical protein [Cyanothece sp. SIO1E1]